MHFRRRFFVFAAYFVLLLAVSASARACLNDIDSDTLIQEGQILPDVVRVVTKRFPRNPPLYYQMRLERVALEIADDPAHLNLYDDAGVACDRLGSDDVALRYMAKKRAQLEKQGGADWKTASPELREAWYRYYANVGTFRIHQWIKNGADRTHLEAVKQARNEIARAIEIKPDAHFNRERYQLAAMNWIINPTVKNSENRRESASFSEYLKRGDLKIPANVSAVEGLSGLIVLGNAWESVDITDALGETLYDNNNTNLAHLAYLRCEELRTKGRTSLVSNAALQDGSLWGLATERLENPEEVKAKFYALRKEAEAWQKKRTAFMMVRLKQGSHPDANPFFWSGYTEAQPPPLDNPSDARLMRQQKETATRNFIGNAVWAVSGVFVAFCAWLAARGVTHLVRRRRVAAK